MKNLFVILAIIFAVYFAGVFAGGYCPDVCKGSVYYYNGQASSSGTCAYRTVPCESGCSGNSCKDVKSVFLRPKQTSRWIGGLTYTDSQSQCGDFCQNNIVYFEGELSDSGKCKYNWQRCYYGCDRSGLHCATRYSSQTRPYIYINSPALAEYPYPIETRTKKSSIKIVSNDLTEICIDEYCFLR